MDWDAFDDRDIQLLPYWLAGRVTDETHTVSLEFLGNEDPMMRSILAGEVVKRKLPVSRREWTAMILDEDLLEDEAAFVESEGLVSLDQVESAVRGYWRFEPAASTADELEQIVLSTAQAEDGIECVAVTWRIGADSTRRRIFIGILGQDVIEQDTLWHRVYSGLIDAANEQRILDKELVRIPPFESIRQGWDWPVYYRDLVANSQLIWSASGEDIDLRALAESQPHDA